MSGCTESSSNIAKSLIKDLSRKGQNGTTFDKLSICDCENAGHTIRFDFVTFNLRGNAPR